MGYGVCLTLLCRAFKCSCSCGSAVISFGQSASSTFTSIFLLHIIFLASLPCIFSSSSALPVVSSLSFSSNYLFLSITHLLTHSPLFFLWLLSCQHSVICIFRPSLGKKNMPQSSGWRLTGCNPRRDA